MHSLMVTDLFMTFQIFWIIKLMVVLVGVRLVPDVPGLLDHKAEGDATVIVFLISKSECQQKLRKIS